MFLQVAIPIKVATISRKLNLMKFTKYSYTFKTAKIANKNYKHITNIIANKLQKQNTFLHSYTPFSLFNSNISNYICNYFHREKKTHYTIHVYENCWLQIILWSQLFQQSGRAKRYTYLYVSLLRPPLPKACRRGGRQFFPWNGFQHQFQFAKKKQRNVNQFWQ